MGVKSWQTCVKVEPAVQNWSILR